MNGSSEKLGEFVRDLGEAARRNPVSAALIGMGAVWLFASRSPRGREIIRRSGIDQLPDAARDAWEGARSSLASENVRAAARGLAEAVHDRGERAVGEVADTGKRLAGAVADYADDFPDRLGSLVDDVRGNLAETFRAQPLAIGVVGLAIGAAIAASFPRTDTEAEYLGETSDLLKTKAGELADEQLERAAEIGTKVAEAAAAEARRQGLTADGLKAAASELSNKAGRVAEGAFSGSGSG